MHCRNNASWRASASCIAARCASHSRVLPSMSVNKNVTVPVGSGVTARCGCGMKGSGKIRPNGSLILQIATGLRNRGTLGRKHNGHANGPSPAARPLPRVAAFEGQALRPVVADCRRCLRILE